MFWVNTVLEATVWSSTRFVSTSESPSTQTLGLIGVWVKDSAALGGAAVPGLFGGGEGRGLRRGEHGGGLFRDAGAFEEARALRTPQTHRIGKGEGTEIVGGDVAVL